MRLYRRLLSFIPLLLTACTVFTSPLATSKDGVSVNIHGVNYTADSFQYVIVDPKDPANSGGGEHIGPFSAGGIMCCYVLPKQWKPGIQVRVQATYWHKQGADGKLQEIKQEHMVEVPRYADGKVGELWVVRTKEGTIELVSSDVQPDHPDWPGRVKGWPEPSLAYQRERWELYLKLAQGSVNTYRSLLSDLESNPQREIHEAWNFQKKYSQDELSAFAGPDDPVFATYLKKRYAEGLKRSEIKLENVKKARP
jgi:hypothetical protein